MKTIVITQARSGSTRLPGKVLLKIKNKTLLEIHIDRIKKAKRVDKIYIATTTNKNDSCIVDLSKDLDVNYFCGSENDVLDRFYQTAKREQPDWVVRLTSDCPLIDPELIDAVIEMAQERDLDYCSNTLAELFPDGQDVEVFKFQALELAWKNAKLNSEREHVTPYIRKNSTYSKGSLFKSENYPAPDNFGMVRLTVDEPNDLEAIRRIVDNLGFDCTWRDYADYYLSHSEIQNLNNNIERNEGYQKSLKGDI